MESHAPLGLPPRPPVRPTRIGAARAGRPSAGCPTGTPTGRGRPRRRAAASGRPPAPRKSEDPRTPGRQRPDSRTPASNRTARSRNHRRHGRPSGRAVSAGEATVSAYRCRRASESISTGRRTTILFNARAGAFHRAAGERARTRRVNFPDSAAPPQASPSSAGRISGEVILFSIS